MGMATGCVATKLVSLVCRTCCVAGRATDWLVVSVSWLFGGTGGLLFLSLSGFRSFPV